MIFQPLTAPLQSGHTNWFEFDTSPDSTGPLPSPS
uniref:Uncharacterized protein n=1 Tax=Arundo donax TaxID=35708 RepID=A0A0A9DUT5_ARUDO